MEPAIPHSIGGQRCVDCGRSTVPQHRWHHMTAGDREGRALRGAHGMCSACYARAKYHGTRPHPAPHQPSSPASAAVQVVAVYTVSCDQCGDIATVRDRSEAYRRSRDHRTGHPVPSDLLPSTPSLKAAQRRRVERKAVALAPDELARLRALVGLPAVLPQERAS